MESSDERPTVASAAWFAKQRSPPRRLILAPRPTTLAKLSPPRLFRPVPRERLFAWLDQRRTHAGMWVCGPPGAGKTTLLASYLERRALPSLWYQVDDGDNDAATFFYYLREAAASTFPRRRISLPLLAPESLADLPGFTRRYCRSLFARLPRPCVLVLEDVHEAAATLSAVVRDVLNEVPEGVCCMLTSRTEPPPELSRQLSTQALNVLDWEALRLTLEETARVVAQVRPMGEDAIRNLHATCGGWAAGLALLLQRERAGVVSEVRRADPRQAVFNYLSCEIFDRVPRENRDLLMRIAFLPQMTAAMAQELGGDVDAASVLNALHRRQLFTEKFTEKRDGAEPTYQFHPLLRAFLLARVQDAHSAAECARLKRRSALVLDRHGDTEEALRLYLDCGEWHAAVALIVRAAPSLMAQGRGRALVDAIGALPREVVAAEIWLSYWLGAARLARDPVAARGHLAHAYAGFKQRDDVTGCYLAIGGVLESYCLAWSELISADPWIAEVETLLRRNPDFPSPEIEARVLSSLQCVIFRAPQHGALTRWTERALELMRASASSDLRLKLASFVLLHHVWCGDLQGVGPLLAAARPLLNAKGTAPLPMIVWKTYESQYYRQTGLPESALQAVQAILELSHATGVHMMDGLAYAEGAYGGLHCGQLGLTEQFVAKMESVLDPARRLDVAHLDLLRSGLMLHRGKPSAALKWAEAGLSICEACGFPLGLGACHIGLAQALIERGQHAIARSHLDTAREVGRGMANPWMAHSSLLLEAYSLLQTGEDVAALSALREGFAIGRQRGYGVIIPWALPKVMARLCNAALAAGIEADHVRTLIKRRGLKPEASTNERWPWPIKLYTFGRFSIVRDDRPVVFTGKTPKKPIALLKTILAFGGREVSERRLADALWAGDEADAAHDALAVNLHRLRKLLGDNGSVILRDGRVSLDASRCWVDAWEFERLLGQASSACDEGGAALAERALALYRGAFLDSERDEAWSLSMRERLRSKFTRHCAELARRQEAAGQWEQAVESYRRGLEAEQLAEEFCQGLLRCYRRLDRRAEGIATYRQLRHALAVVLGTTPCAATDALYRELTAD
jgi:DNA-binding SARP family transcriptional activator